MQRSTQNGQKHASNQQESDGKGPRSQSTGSTFDSMHEPSLQASRGPGTPTLSKRSKSYSGAMDCAHLQVGSSGSGTDSGQKIDKVDIDSNNEKGELDSKL